MSNEILLSGDVKEFEAFLNKAAWQGNLEKMVRRGLTRCSLVLLKEIKTRIIAKRYLANSPLTLALAKRGKKTPLLKEKNLVDAMSYAIIKSFEAEVGFVKAAESTGGVRSGPHEMKKVVELMHKGYIIDVTPKMRKAIFAALNEQRTAKGRLTQQAKGIVKGLQLKGLRRTMTWRVPPRPFLTEVYKDPAVIAKLRQVWRESLESFFQKQGAKGGEHKEK